MAIPTPRSFVEILSEMLATFTSRAKIRTLKVGNPILTILEAAAQSDVRSSQDLFSLLESNSVDYSDANSLREKLKSEGAEEFGSRTASGFVNFSDSTITKIETVVYQNNAVPGTTSLQVADASTFPASGSVYIGRNTANYEGPISYSSKTDFGTYWTLTLGSGIVNFHNSAETVILSQGSGLREIPVGTIIEVPAGSDSIQFSTKATVFIDDGEQLIENIEVVCQQPGTIGNVPARSIKNVVSNVFPGISVINTTAFTNGFDLETVEQLRARLKKVRASKTKGTDTANEVYSLGVSSSDNKTVVSSKVYEFDKKATLYIDDGTGYEESFAGISNEPLVDIALGGEQYFNLSQRPVANAFLVSTFRAPFDLSSNPVLSVLVNGVGSEHQFSDTDFKNPYAASIYEVAASINSNSLLDFYAKTTEGDKICLFGKNKENEIQGSTPSVGIDANDAFGFSLLKTFTLRLFKNGELLNQDGESAFVYSEPQNLWGSLSSGATLSIKVDNTTTQVVTITDQDFIDNLTGYISVSQFNSLASWVTVLNSKIAGVTVTASANKLLLTSNRGQNVTASVEIISGSLVSSGVFTAQSSMGQSKDFEFNKNYSQIKLVTPLVAGDELKISSPDTRAFTDSEPVSSSTNFATDFTILLFHNSEAETVATGLNSSITLTLTNPATRIARYTSASPLFVNLQVDDWIYAPTQTFAVVDDTLLRVSAVDSAGYWFETERATITPNTGVFTTNIAVRSTVPPEGIVIPAGTYSPSAIISTLNGFPQIKASLTASNRVRLATRTYKSTGSIFLAGTSATTLVFDTGVRLVSNDPEVAYVESASEIGAPYINVRNVTTGGASSISTVATDGTTINFRSTDILSAKKTANVGSQKYLSTVKDDYMTIGRTITPSTGTFDIARINDFLPSVVTVGTPIFTVAPYGFAANDELSVSMDQDSDVPKTFQIPFYRTLKPAVGAVYGASEFEVLESPGLTSLYTAFGTLPNNFFNNFAALMRARGKSHSTTANKTILFRNGDYGSQGERNRVAFKNATGPSKAMELSLSTQKENMVYNIHLPSGATKTPTLLAADHLYAELENHNYVSTGLTRVGTTVTVTLGPAGVVSHALSINDIVIKSPNHADFPLGPKTVTGVTANTFTYTEAGAAVTTTLGDTFQSVAKAAGTTYTVNAITSSSVTDSITFTTTTPHNFVVGDYVYFPMGHFEVGGTIPWGGWKVTSVPSTTSVVVYYAAATTFSATLASGVTYTISEGMHVPVHYVFTNYHVAIGGGTRSGTTVTMTFTKNGVVGDHGFIIGDVVYVNSADANYAAGYKTVTGVTSTTISYQESGTAVASLSAIGVAYNATLTPNFAGIVAGDILSKGVTYRKLSTVSSGLLRTKKDGGVGFYNWEGLTSRTALKKAGSDFSFYANTATSAATIVTWVNANAKDDLGNQLLTATLVPNNGGVGNDGSATITTATDEEFFDQTNNASFNGAGNRCVDAFPLFGGYQGIFSNNVTFATSRVRFKDRGFSGELTSNADFVNEVFKIVPTTAINVSTLLSSPAYSGFYNSGASAVSSRNSVQLSHKLAGNQYNLQVSGGTANNAFATSTSGAALLIDGGGRHVGFSISTDVSDLNGFVGGSWVSVQNEEALIKNITALSGTVTLSASGDSTLATFGGGYVPVICDNVTVGTSNVFRFENHTNFSSLQDQSGSLLNLLAVKSFFSTGDLGYFVLQNASAANTGLKKIVGFDFNTNTIFFEGACVPETVTGATNDALNFIKYNSWSVSDRINVTNDALGASNNGIFTISGFVVNGSGVVEAQQLLIAEPMVAGAYSLAANIVVAESEPIKVYGIVDGISASGTIANIIVGYSSKLGYPLPGAVSRISKNAIITALNKLDFDTTVVQGVDGYKYNTGLLAEVNKVIFGDEDNSFMYPGVAATGTDLDISGPFIKRINVSLAIRAQQADQDNLIIKVKNAVATVINQSAVGESIALSDLVDAANSIDGVFSVVMLSPAMTSSTDLIKTQPYEKARVLDVDLDISVGLLG